MTDPQDALRRALQGRYVIERELGRGGMGIVYLARDVALDRPVAIKLLPPNLAGLPDVRQRFLREARAAARLSHPNIVPIHSVDEADGLVWFVMAWVPGESLAERVRREGPLSPRDASRMVQEVAWALAYAHQHGVVHRDIKPENVLVERGTGRYLVVDFGIARLADEAGLSPAGELFGTPRLVSPEQAGGEAVDGRSDLYSLGVTAFFALTGRYPFESENVGQLLAQHLTVPAPPVASLRAGLPAPLAAAVDRCLAKSPDERFPDGEALAAAISLAQPAPVPRILQLLAREISTLGVDLVSFDSLVAVAIITLALTRDFLGFGYVYTVGLALALLAVTAIRGLSIARLTRDASREGWDARDLIDAAAIDAQESTSPAPPLGRRFALYGAGMLATLLFWLGPKQWGLEHADTALGVLIELIALATPVALGRWLGNALEAPRNGKPGLISSFFLRWKAGLFFKLVGVRKALAAPSRPVAGQPTELLLAAQARELFRGLSAAERESLGEVSGAIARLERDADRLRQRLDELARAAGEVGAGAGGREGVTRTIEAERAEAARQLGGTINALEELRLDLLRVKSGIADRGGLTRSLEQLRQLSAGVDALLGTGR
ncbi:MAG TPA: serine/threonine-protein kinase [Gemmatimonadales bacterium]|nr:serine/threonine-protein kinase [Gemmatimonadales bacterium]